MRIPLSEPLTLNQSHALVQNRRRKRTPESRHCFDFLGSNDCQTAVRDARRCSSCHFRSRARYGHSCRWRGRIVNISTDAARAFPNQVCYGTSKVALEAMTRAAAMELGPLGITVNAIAPGPVQTGYIDAALAAKVIPAIPLRRLGTPEDIGAAVLFFLSDASAWVTGQAVQVAGGHAL